MKKRSPYDQWIRGHALQTKNYDIGVTINVLPRTLRKTRNELKRDAALLDALIKACMTACARTLLDDPNE